MAKSGGRRGSGDSKKFYGSNGRNRNRGRGNKGEVDLDEQRWQGEPADSDLLGGLVKGGKLLNKPRVLFLFSPDYNKKSVEFYQDLVGHLERRAEVLNFEGDSLRSRFGTFSRDFDLPLLSETDAIVTDITKSHEVIAFYLGFFMRHNFGVLNGGGGSIIETLCLYDSKKPRGGAYDIISRFNSKFDSRTSKSAFSLTGYENLKGAKDGIDKFLKDLGYK